MRSRSESQEGRKKDTTEEAHHYNYNSPPYTKRRDLQKEGERQRRYPFPQRGLSEWRLKPTAAHNMDSESGAPDLALAPRNKEQSLQQIDLQEGSKEQPEDPVVRALNEATIRYLTCADPTESAARRLRVLVGDERGENEEGVANRMRTEGISRDSRPLMTLDGQAPMTLSKEQVMKELHEATQQYLSCADPVEAAAQRQRVLATDAEGLMEHTAESILAAASEQRRPLSPWEMGIRSVSPPGIDFDIAMQPSDIETTPPPKIKATDATVLPKRAEQSHPIATIGGDKITD